MLKCFYMVVLCGIAISSPLVRAIDSYCCTPDARYGLCIEIEKCPSIYSIVMNPNRTPQNDLFVRQSLCSQNGNVVTICCPDIVLQQMQQASYATLQTSSYQNYPSQGLPQQSYNSPVDQFATPQAQLQRLKRQVLWNDQPSPTNQQNMPYPAAPSTNEQYQAWAYIAYYQIIQQSWVNAYAQHQSTTCFASYLQTPTGQPEPGVQPMPPGQPIHQEATSTLPPEPQIVIELLPEAPACGKKTVDSRIAGGHVTAIDEFPWVALIKYTNKVDNRVKMDCAGSLINNLYVITAAHCIVSDDPNWVISGVRLGEWNLTSTPMDCDCIENDDCTCADPHVDIEVESIISHPLYNLSHTNHHNDIGLLRLASPVKYSDFIKPICLPFESKLPNVVDKQPVEVTGFGRTETQMKSDIKLKASLSITDFSTCRYQYRSRITVNYNQICAAGANGEDACKGDSGGPLMVLHENFYYVAGIVSIGPDSCGNNYMSGIYTKVNRYLKWIKSEMTL